MILVTGAAGLLGREVVRELGAHGASVRGLDVVPAPDPRLPGYQARTGDLLDPAVCRWALEGVSAVVHAAAVQFHTPGCPRVRLERFFGRNIAMTGHLLQACQAAGIERFVFVSSDMVYGALRAGPMREDGPTRPAGPYGRSKLAGEDQCRRAREGIAHVVILRPSMTIGPGRLGLLKRLFDRVRTDRPIPMLGHGANRHHMIAVDDLARACRLALSHPGHGTYNIGSRKPTPVRDLLAEVCRRAGSRSRLVAMPAAPAVMVLDLLWRVRLSVMNPEQYLIAPRDYVLDTSAARAELGFEARHRDVDALFATYRWYLDRLSA